MKILMINTDWSTNQTRDENNSCGGVGHYRLMNPAKVLRKKGHKVDVVGKLLAPVGKKPDPKLADLEGDEVLNYYAKMFKKYDVIVTKGIDNPNAAKAIGFVANHLKIPLVVDIDDNFFHISKNQPAYGMGYAPGEAKRGFQAAYVSLANAVFCSTKPLKEQLSAQLFKLYGEAKTFFVLPNCSDDSEWQYDSTKNKNKVVIGWAGSMTHDDDLLIALPALQKILKKYENVHLELMGGVRKESSDRLFGSWGDELERVQCTAGTREWASFPKALMSKKWDIGIAPLVDNEFNRAKSHIKYLENAMKELPTVFSKVYPYSESIADVPTVIDGETGLLATPDQWYEKIEWMIEHPKERQKLAQNMKKHVQDVWQQEHWIDEYEKALQSVIDTGV